MKMKEFLENLIDTKNEEAEELREQIKKSESADEVRSLGETLDKVLNELKEAKEQLAKLDDEEGKEDNDGQAANEGRSAFNPNQAFNVVATAKMNEQGEARSNTPLSTMEYRQAFMKYAQTGERSEALNSSLAEYRSLQYRAEGGETVDTTLNEVVSTQLGVLLPHTVVQEIITRVEKVRGNLYARVKKLNVRGGVEYPIGAFDAEFFWGGKDGKDTEHGVSKEQGVEGVTDSVIFAYHIGEVRISQSLLQSILTVEAFEKELVNALVAAYVTAMDKAIMFGTGKAQPTGILTEANKTDGRIPAENIIEFTEEEIADWTAWERKLFAEIPMALEAENPEFVMAKQTYVSNLCTLKDGNNQPIKKAGFDSSDKKHKFNEYEVNRVEKDIFTDFNSAQDGDYFGMLWVPEKAYGINSNMAFGYRKYYDEDNNKWVNKGLVITDGKPLNTDYIYLLKKKAPATEKSNVPQG